MIEVIEKLKQLEGANFSEVCAKYVFECYRMRNDGCMQEVTVVVLDAGPGAAAHARYYCHAKSEEGRQVSSRLEPTLDAALASIRWAELDPEPAPVRDEQVLPPSSPPSAPPEAPRNEYDRRDLFDRFRRRLVKKSGQGGEP
jgi:hypothetical protein